MQLEKGNDCHTLFSVHYTAKIGVETYNTKLVLTVIVYCHTDFPIYLQKFHNCRNKRNEKSLPKWKKALGILVVLLVVVHGQVSFLGSHVGPGSDKDSKE